MCEYTAYISDYIPFRGYHIVVRHDGFFDNGGELGKDYTAAIEKLTQWAQDNGYRYGDCGAWFKDA